MKTVTITAKGDSERVLEQFNNSLNKKALENNITKGEALSLVLDEIRNIARAEVDLKGDKYELDKANTKIEQLKKQIAEMGNSTNKEEVDELYKQLKERENRINELEETVRRYAENTTEAAKLWENERKWIMPANMGSVCLALIMDNSPDFAEVVDVETACAFILRPYHREGKFIPDTEDLDNYQTALVNGFVSE